VIEWLAAAALLLLLLQLAMTAALQSAFGGPRTSSPQDIHSTIPFSLLLLLQLIA